MKYYFCTYFDSSYLIQGMALYHSLAAQKIDFYFYVACLDARAFDILSALNEESIVPIRLSDIEEYDCDFANSRKNRSKIEYYFTLSPVLPLFIFDRFPEIDILTYLDADLLFYSSPQKIYEEFENNSILIIEHRFPQDIKWREKFGRFNVQCQLYRRDADGIECLKWWREKCIEWCYDRLEDGRFADQKYLDSWPETFKNVHVLKNKGAGLAPWNWSQYKLKVDSENKLTVDGEPLIFYHFQGFKILNRFLIDHSLGNYERVMSRQLLNWFYLGYIKELKAVVRWLESKTDISDLSIYRSSSRAGFSILRTIASGIKHRCLMFYLGE